MLDEILKITGQTWLIPYVNEVLENDTRIELDSFLIPVDADDTSVNFGLGFYKFIKITI